MTRRTAVAAPAPDPDLDRLLEALSTLSLAELTVLKIALAELVARRRREGLRSSRRETR